MRHCVGRGRFLWHRHQSVGSLEKTCLSFLHSFGDFGDRHVIFRVFCFRGNDDIGFSGQSACYISEASKTSWWLPCRSSWCHGISFGDNAIDYLPRSLGIHVFLSFILLHGSKKLVLLFRPLLVVGEEERRRRRFAPHHQTALLLMTVHILVGWHTAQ